MIFSWFTKEPFSILHTLELYTPEYGGLAYRIGETSSEFHQCALAGIIQDMHSQEGGNCSWWGEKNVSITMVYNPPKDHSTLTDEKWYGIKMSWVSY